MNSYGMRTQMNRSGRSGFCNNLSVFAKQRTGDWKAPLSFKQPQCKAQEKEVYPPEELPRQQQEGLSRTGHSSSTIQRMSIAATGRRHSRSTIMKITESQTGRTLSASHKAAIAAGQRRRHATRRLRVAMEALHQELTVTCDEVAADDEERESDLLATKSQAPVSSDPVDVPKYQPGKHETSALPETSPSIMKQVPMLGDEQLDDVHREYAMRLKNFRRLQSELRPWIEAFRNENGRKPELQDAMSARQAGIYETFLEFLQLKDSLMVEIPAMRAALDSKSTATGSKTKRSPSLFNSNRVSFNITDAASRVQSARDYRKHAASQLSSAGALASEKAAPQTTESRLAALQSKAGQVSGPENPRAKSALLKALAYKQKRAEQAREPDGSRTSGSQPFSKSGSAVKLVSVEGKAIGGIDYSAVDASRAAAGESILIKAGVSPVQSYRKPSSILDKDDVGLADAMKAVQDTPVAAEEGLSKNAVGVRAANLRKEKTRKSVTVSSEKSVKALTELLSCADGDHDNLRVQADTAGQHEQVSGGSAAAQPSGRGSGGSEPCVQDRRGSVNGDQQNGLMMPANASIPDTSQGCSTASLLELRGKQAAATAAVEAAAAAAVVAVQAGVHSAAVIEHTDVESPHIRLIDAMCEAAKNAREVHAEFEAVRGNVMQGLQDAPETYLGGLVLLSRLL